MHPNDWLFWPIVVEKIATLTEIAESWCLSDILDAVLMLKFRNDGRTPRDPSPLRR